ncbi:MAG: 50S ribosomal protein L44e [Candidatus Woesearchaeota archaeon]
MKLPKSMKRLCPKCKKHTEHKVASSKKKGMGSVHTLSRGSKIRVMARGEWRGAGNQGRFSRPPVAQRKRTGSKQSKKTDLRYQCKECNYTHTQVSGTRTKKLEFV